MTLSILQTELLLEEIPTDGHAPLKFICNDGNIYYCKYLNSYNRAEINCLAYEVVAQFLLKQLGIPTPDIALVKVAPNTLVKSKIQSNRRLREGNICFASRDVPYVNELQEIQNISKADFNKLINPNDVIKIAAFDLWVNNVDRGRRFPGGINYNLLIQTIGSKQKIYAFDNAFIFGGVNNIGIFNPKLMVSPYNKFVSSSFYANVVKQLDVNNFNDVVNNFIPLLGVNYCVQLKEIIDILGEYWELSPNLDRRINAYLSNADHVSNCKNIMLQSKK